MGIGLDCCIPKISSKEAILQNNLMPNAEIKCKERLLFLYNFLETLGCNLSLYPTVVNNIKSICGNSCCDGTTSTTGRSDLVVNIRIQCDDSILAESFVIY